MHTLGGLCDIFFIKLLMYKVQMIRQLFVLELEQGQESYIPRELSHDSLPYSFRFYDPIIQIVDRHFSKDSRTYFSLKN